MKSDLPRARSVNEIYDVVKDYDRVITRDSALADALDLRVDRPLLKGFAFTPRGLVYDREIEAEMRDRRELFLSIQRETNLNWKETFHFLQRALSAWQETGDLESVGQYPPFRNDQARQLLDCLQGMNSIFLGMQRFEPKKNDDVAVIEPAQFTPLERQVLPSGYDSFSVLDSHGTFEFPPFQIFPSTTALVETVTENVDRNNARDVALIVEPESPYQPLLESAFEYRDVPYMPAVKTLTQNENFRTLHKIMYSAFTQNRLRIRDILPVLHQTGRRIPLQHHASFLRSYEHEAIERVKQILKSVPTTSFEEIVTVYEELTGNELETFRNELQNLGYLNRKITPERLSNLEFYLSSFDVEIDRSKQGVLFASPKSAAYVDRPVVLYLGLGASWTRSIPDQPWVDRERQRRSNLIDFQVLIQNGEHPYYFVQEQRHNEDVTPCFYFNVLFDEPFEAFTDHDYQTIGSLPEPEAGSGFSRSKRNVPAPKKQTISQSSLNIFVKSPRDYFFERLVPTVKNIPMRKGQVFHDFAEFYVNYPGVVRETDRKEILDIMEGAMIDLTDEWNLATIRTEFQIGIENITEYLVKEDYETFQPKGYESDRFERDNVFTEHFDNLSIHNPISEAWFEDRNLGAHGVVDLVPSKETLIDFKSSRMRSTRKIIEQAGVEDSEPISNDPDFQAIVYLAHHRRHYPDRKLQFTFFHFLENLSERMEGGGCLDDTLVTVTYYPREFVNQVPRRSTYEFLVEDLSEHNDRRKTLKGLGYDSFRRFFSEHSFPDTVKKDEALNSPITGKFITFCQQNYNHYNYVTKGAKSTIKKLIDFRRKNFFQEAVERFEDFLSSQLELLNHCRTEDFPIENGIRELDLDELNHRDLIVDDRNRD